MTLGSHVLDSDAAIAFRLLRDADMCDLQVRTLPAVLKFLPSEKAQDARNFVQSLQYWLGGNAENLENLLLNTAVAYVPALKGVDIDVLEPQLFPDVGIWHPTAPSTSMYSFASNHACLMSMFVLARCENVI